MVTSQGMQMSKVFHACQGAIPFQAIDPCLYPRCKHDIKVDRPGVRKIYSVVHVS